MSVRFFVRFILTFQYGVLYVWSMDTATNPAPTVCDTATHDAIKASRWLTLPFLGVQHCDDEPSRELRNCDAPGCCSTLSMPLNAPVVVAAHMARLFAQQSKPVLEIAHVEVTDEVSDWDLAAIDRELEKHDLVISYDGRNAMTVLVARDFAAIDREVA